MPKLGLRKPIGLAMPSPMTIAAEIGQLTAHPPDHRHNRLLRADQRSCGRRADQCNEPRRFI
jgi:hypothetical protein